MWLRGLRPRLVVAFVIVTVAGAGLASWASVAAGSAALVASSEQRLGAEFADRIGAVTPQLRFPPDQAALDALHSAVGDDSLVVFGGLESGAGVTSRLLTPELRRAVADGDRVSMQRVVTDGRPWLLLGTPVALTSPDGARRASGIVVYEARDLSDVQSQIDGLVRSAGFTSALSLPLAIVLALLVARSVLRPVRELRDTARRLAAGDLDARSPSGGADEVAELTATINEMAGAVQKSVATTNRMEAEAKRFAADVSHELRTPLSTLTAVTEVLADAADRMEPEAQESAQLAITETQRLVTLMEDLMEVSRFDAGTARVRVDNVDLGDAVRASIRARGWADRVEVVVEDIPAMRLDRRRLDVIVANLVGNALRHGAPPVLVRVHADDRAALVEVVDHGDGLTEHVAAHVFDRFYKHDTARARTPGSGLGLALARENARLHGGDVIVGAAEEAGARFVLMLPLPPREGPAS